MSPALGALDVGAFLLDHAVWHIIVEGNFEEGLYAIFVDQMGWGGFATIVGVFLMLILYNWTERLDVPVVVLVLLSGAIFATVPGFLAGLGLRLIVGVGTIAIGMALWRITR